MGKSGRSSKNRSRNDQDELVRLVRGATGDDMEHGQRGHTRTIIIKESQSSGGSLTLKFVTCLLAALVVILLLDSIEFKFSNIKDIYEANVNVKKNVTPSLENVTVNEVDVNSHDSVSDSEAVAQASNANESTENASVSDSDANEQASDGNEPAETSTEQTESVESSTTTEATATSSTTESSGETSTATNQPPDSNEVSSGLSGVRAKVYQRRGQPMSDDDRKKMIDEWGSWTLVDDKKSQRPQDDFYKAFPNRDVPRDKFPPNAWQLDQEYLPKFLTEGKDLVMRAMEAILAEYGHGKSEGDLSFEERAKMFEIVRDETPNLGANGQGGRTTVRSWSGLKRRLLHSIMTEDNFVFAMGGHSAAAGHGNHFVQSYTVQVQWILEPVFARLGVRHQARNFGNGGMGTVHNAIGAGSLYGPDVDMLMWDSGMTEKGVIYHQIFSRQALTGGLKVPVLWSLDRNVMISLHDTVDADVGTAGSAMSGIPTASTKEELDQIAWAARYMSCKGEINNDFCKPAQYNGTCWIDRDDVTPVTPQNNAPGGRASWHPGNRVHQLTGRVLAFTILQALYEALDDWSKADSYALDDSEWHVTAYYDNIRSKVPGLGPCSNVREDFSFLCNATFKARTEFTPRAYPELSNLVTLMLPDMKANLPPERYAKAVYEPPDVFNPYLHPPPGEVDVLSIVESGNEFEGIMDPSYADFYETVANPPKPSQDPGKGLGWATGLANSDRCDGSLDSWCNRGAADKCLLYGHNDCRNGFQVDGYSGWLMMNLPKVRQGYIVVKYESYHDYNKQTEGWTSVNNEGGTRQLEGQSFENEQVGRKLKFKPRAFCDDFMFEYSIDGQVTKLNLTEWQEKSYVFERVVELLTVLTDPDYTGGEEKDVELGLRISGCQREKTFSFTHVYWA